MPRTRRERAGVAGETDIDAAVAAPLQHRSSASPDPSAATKSSVSAGLKGAWNH